jgi:hypothetical protein
VLVLPLALLPLVLLPLVLVLLLLLVLGVFVLVETLAVLLVGVAVWAGVALALSVVSPLLAARLSLTLPKLPSR